MTTPKLILFNGPRHSGKDTAALHCVRVYGAYHFKMSRPLKAGLKAMLDLSEGTVDYLESIKTEKTDILFGRSYVELQISLSEEWFKQLWGPFVFGKLAAQEVRRQIASGHGSQLYVCSDSGFAAEAEPLVELFGAENVLLVQINRPGKTFDGDSRSYIVLPGVTTTSVVNDGEESTYKQSIELVLGYWLSGPEQNDE